jgi:uncharacterized membrane protein (DUF4010 family)
MPAETGVLTGGVIALLLGLLLGFERERSKKGDERVSAGVRTFPLLTLAGYLGALAGAHGAAWVLPAVLLGATAVVVVSYLRTSERDPGVTTEFTELLSPLLGALVAWGQTSIAASLTVLVALLLTLKAPLHRIAGRITEDEILSILKFAIVAVVVVPLLPRQAWGPYDAVVPRDVGFVVVVISAISLAGYLLVKFLGGRSGWALAGLLGGLVSSTAVTLTLSGKARTLPKALRSLAVGILLASMVLYARGAALLALFDPPLGLHVVPRILPLFALGAVFAYRAWRRANESEPGHVAVGNPVELTRAVALGLLFATLLVVARSAQARLGTAGLWAASAAGGLLDVDAVAVTNARLRGQGLSSLDAAAGGFLLATLSNLAMKFLIVAAVGGRDLLRLVGPAFAALGVTTAILMLWP